MVKTSIKTFLMGNQAFFVLTVLEANQTEEEHIEEAAVQLFEDLANDGIKAMIETNGNEVSISCT